MRFKIQTDERIEIALDFDLCFSDTDKLIMNMSWMNEFESFWIDDFDLSILSLISETKVSMPEENARSKDIRSIILSDVLYNSLLLA